MRMRSWKTAAIVGGGALAAAVIAALTLRKEAQASPGASPNLPVSMTTAGGRWTAVPVEGGVYKFVPGYAYVVSGPTEGMPVETDVIRRELKDEGLTVLDISTTPPAGLPASEVKSGYAYLLFTPDKLIQLKPQFPRPVYVLG